jgi:hypothetical protein
MRTISRLEQAATTIRLQADAAEHRALDLERKHQQAKQHAKAARLAAKKARKAAKQSKRRFRAARREADDLLEQATETQRQLTQAIKASQAARARKVKPAPAKPAARPRTSAPRRRKSSASRPRPAPVAQPLIIEPTEDDTTLPAVVDFPAAGTQPLAMTAPVPTPKTPIDQPLPNC